MKLFEVLNLKSAYPVIKQSDRDAEVYVSYTFAATEPGLPTIYMNVDCFRNPRPSSDHTWRYLTDKLEQSNLDSSDSSWRKIYQQYGSSYDVRYSPANKSRKKGEYDMFNTKGRHVRILMSVLKAIEMLVAERKVIEITFSADEVEGIKPGKDVGSRVSLYDKMINKFASHYGFQLDERDSVGTMVFYTLIKTDLK